VEGSGYLTTFDRQELAQTAARELAPVVRADGTLAAKSDSQLADDLRRAFLELGRSKLKRAILGDGEDAGLDLARGLELEARLVLGAKGRANEDVTADEVAHYIDQKVHALAQLAGVMARVERDEAAAYGDGVVVSRMRQVLVGTARNADPEGGLSERMRAVLEEGGRQVQLGSWYDPRLAVVHDVEAPIPIYYLRAVTGEIEAAYLAAAADEQRSYNLHTDYNWENSLPNLNPRKSEIAVGWSLKMLADGLLGGVISQAEDGRWIWTLASGGGAPTPLGSTLAAALYRLSEMHRHEDLGKVLDGEVRQAYERLDPAVREDRRKRYSALFQGALTQMGLREQAGKMSREDGLDRPILRALDEHFRSLPEESAKEGAGRYRIEL